MSEPKRGPFSAEEKKYLRANGWKVPFDQMASHLGRKVEMVEKWVKQRVARPGSRSPEEQAEAERVTVREELRSSEAWKALKDEFTTAELKFFEESYLKLMVQFRGDVMASEETQIFQAVKFEILMSRNLRERMELREDIDRTKKMLADTLAPFGGDLSQMADDDKDRVTALDGQLLQMRAAEQGRTGEYVKLQDQHGSLLKSLKSTRDQRVQNIESNKVNFLTVIKRVQDKRARDKDGRRMDLMRQAGNKALKDLSESVTYEDNTTDSPILSADRLGGDSLGDNSGDRELDDLLS